MQQNFPRIVRNGSMHAVAVKEDAANVHLLCLNSDRATYTALALPTLTFKRQWGDVDEWNKLGNTLPTVERYMQTIARSALAVDQAGMLLINHLKENVHMTYSVYVSPKGEVLAQNAEGCIELDAQKSIEENAALIEEKLSQRALAAFVSNALKLEKALQRMHKGDTRIGQALKAALPVNSQGLDTNAIAKAAANAAQSVQAKANGEKQQQQQQQQARKQARKSNGSSDDGMDAPKPEPKQTKQQEPKPKATQRAAPIQGGVKAMIHAFLKAGKKATLEQFLAMCKPDTKVATVKTAISDIRNPKYAPNGDALNVVVNDDGVYSVSKKK